MKDHEYHRLKAEMRRRFKEKAAKHRDRAELIRKLRRIRRSGDKEYAYLFSYDLRTDDWWIRLSIAEDIHMEEKSPQSERLMKNMRKKYARMMAERPRGGPAYSIQA